MGNNSLEAEMKTRYPEQPTIVAKVTVLLGVYESYICRSFSFFCATARWPTLDLGGPVGMFCRVVTAGCLR